VRLGNSLDADRRYKSDGISDTFALMRNDGKLDNQTLHVLNVSFPKFVQHYVTDGKSISSFSDSLVYPFNRNFCLFSFKVRLSLSLPQWNKKRKSDPIWCVV
jgi:hypothetical protein